MNTESSSGIDNASLYGRDMSRAIQRVAPEFSVTVKVIAREGEPYPARARIVPQGSEYVRVIARECRDLTDFWHRVDEETKKIHLEDLFEESVKRFPHP